ncbi:MAG: ABC transporter permease [Rhodospirillaceae bacterium]|nr:ABC transporter permease [Rhodospirillaceae bacterium]
MTDRAAATFVARRLGVLGAVLAKPSGAFGVGIVALHLVLALFGPLFVPYDYAQQNVDTMMLAPSAEHWFGTDRLGRDVFTRTVLGGREAIVISTLATVIAMAWGGFLGIFLALVGGRIDEIIMRGVDAMLSLPWVLTVMIFVTALGTSSSVLVPVLGFSYGLAVIRIARSAALDFVARDFILAAQARGERRWTIVIRELLPNVRDALSVEAAMQWSWMILGFSSLSFLGFGVAPPTPDWGLMISDSRGLMAVAPWTVLWPMAALSTLVIGINLAADAFAKVLGVDRTRKVPGQ